MAEIEKNELTKLSQQLYIQSKIGKIKNYTIEKIRIESNGEKQKISLKQAKNQVNVFYRIPKEIQDLMMTHKFFSSLQLRQVLNIIIQRSYGFNKLITWYNPSKDYHLLKMNSSNYFRLFKKLRQANIIYLIDNTPEIKENNNIYTDKVIFINEYIDIWKIGEIDFELLFSNHNKEFQKNYFADDLESLRQPAKNNNDSDDNDKDDNDSDDDFSKKLDEDEKKKQQNE